MRTELRTLWQVCGGTAQPLACAAVRRIALVKRGLTICAAVFLLTTALAASARGQALTNRGFIEGSATFFPQSTDIDDTRAVADALARDEVFVKPASWLQFATALDFRANSHQQVEDDWRLDWDDRSIERPRLSLRRFGATISRGPFVLELGKQVVRWGKTDIINPTDRLAPRDFLTIINTEPLAVLSARTTVQAGPFSFEAVWVPRFTPSRLPLPTQRWAATPDAFAGATIVELPTEFPERGQGGARVGYLGNRLEFSVSMFDGFNHSPDIALIPVSVLPGLSPQIPITAPPLAPTFTAQRIYPHIRVYGADLAIPTRWITIKAEAAFVTSPEASTNEYWLYTVQLERQQGEWTFVGGYVDDHETDHRVDFSFAPDRGLSRALVAHVSRTLSPTRQLGFEAVARRNGDGAYGKLEFTQSLGKHWRVVATAIGLGGHGEDFLGQYHRNSHVSVTTRYSF